MKSHTSIHGPLTGKRRGMKVLSRCEAGRLLPLNALIAYLGTRLNHIKVAIFLSPILQAYPSNALWIYYKR